MSSERVTNHRDRLLRGSDCNGLVSLQDSALSQSKFRREHIMMSRVLSKSEARSCPYPFTVPFQHLTNILNFPGVFACLPATLKTTPQSIWNRSFRRLS